MRKKAAYRIYGPVNGEFKVVFVRPQDEALYDPKLLGKEHWNTQEGAEWGMREDVKRYVRENTKTRPAHE